MCFFFGWRRELRGKEATEEEKRGKSCKFERNIIYLQPKTIKIEDYVQI
jgi:hypothetical protein